MKNALIAALALGLLVSTSAAVFFHRAASLQAPPRTGAERADLAALDSYAAWHQLVETLRQAGEATVRDGADGAPNPQDAIDRFHGLLAILSNTSRIPLNDDPARPLIQVSDLQPALTKIGGNSPDAEYHAFPVSPAFRYRLTGRRSRAPFFNLQVQSMRFDPVALRPRLTTASSLAAADLDYDANDRFEILIARARPADWTGDFLAMDDDSFTVTIREYHHDAVAEGDPDLAVELVGETPSPARLTDAVVAGRIRRAAAMSRFWFSARDWMPGLLEPTALNGFPAAGAPTIDDDADLALNQHVQYRVGAWAVDEDEVLLVEGRFPADAPYWIFQIEDRWHETADFRSRRVHLNDATVTLESDGGFRIPISPVALDHPNALDTGGRREGFMSFRWVPTGNDPTRFDVRTRVLPRASLDD